MLSKFIPGYNTATNLASAGGGAVLGGGIMAIINSTRIKKQTKEICSLNELNESLNERIGIVSDKEQEKTIIKVGILKRFAWKDGEFHHKEYKFIVDYIIRNRNLQADVKIQLIEDLNSTLPPAIKFFKPIINFFSSLNGFFENEEEKLGFINIVEQLMHIDGKIHSSEEKFLQQLKGL